MITMEFHIILFVILISNTNQSYHHVKFSVTTYWIINIMKLINIKSIEECMDIDYDLVV